MRYAVYLQQCTVPIIIICNAITYLYSEIEMHSYDLDAKFTATHDVN